MVPSTARAAAQPTGLPPKVEPCWPGPSSSAAGPKARQAPMRQPAAEPLGEGDHVRLDALGLVGEPVPGTPDAGLHLVEDEQRAVPAR